VNYYNYFTEVEEHFVRRRGKHLLVSPMDWSLIATWRQSGVPLHVALRGIDRAMDGFFARPRRSGKVNSLFYCHDTVMEEFTRYLEAHTGEQAPAESAGSAAGTSTSPGGSPDPTVDRDLPAGGTGDGAVRKQQILEFLEMRKREIGTLRAKQSIESAPELAPGLDRVLGRLDEIARSLEGEQPLAADRAPGARKRSNVPGSVDEEALDRDLGILDDALVRELSRIIPAERTAGWAEEAKKELKIYRKRLPKETYSKITENFMRRKLHRHFELGELSLFHL
jgi:hypothetical protein